MSEIKMLPLPEPFDEHRTRDSVTVLFTDEQLDAHALAVAEHNVAARDAEIEAVTAEAFEWRGLFDMAKARADKAEARAERLAEALLELCNVIDGHEVHVAVEGKAAHARAALRDHDKEGKDRG